MSSINTQDSKTEDQSGDHLPKRNTTEMINRMEEILEGNEKLPLYDRPDDDGQSRLANKTPGSEIQAKGGIPSWKKHSGG